MEVGEFRCVRDGGFEAPIAKIKAYSYACIGSTSSNNINEEVLMGFRMAIRVIKRVMLGS